MLAHKGPTALVTGASGGLGEAFAEQLAQQGYNLVLVARSEDKLKMVAQRLEQLHKIKTTVIAADLGSPAAVEHVIAEVKRRGVDIDLLVNNAGFGIFERFVETPLYADKKPAICRSQMDDPQSILLEVKRAL